MQDGECPAPAKPEAVWMFLQEVSSGLIHSSLHFAVELRGPEMSHLSIHFVPGTLLDVCKDLGLLFSAGNLFVRGRAWNKLQRPWGLIRLWDQDIFITLCPVAPCSFPGRLPVPTPDRWSLCRSALKCQMSALLDSQCGWRETLTEWAITPLAVPAEPCPGQGQL